MPISHQWMKGKSLLGTTSCRSLSSLSVERHKLYDICKEPFTTWPCGLMDKALVFGTKDCRFESCQGHCMFCLFHRVVRLLFCMEVAR